MRALLAQYITMELLVIGSIQVLGYGKEVCYLELCLTYKWSY